MKLLIGFQNGRTGNNLVLLANLFTAADKLPEAEVVHFGMQEIGLMEHARYQELYKWVMSQGDNHEVVTENQAEYINKFRGNIVTRIMDTKFNWSEISPAREYLIQLLSQGLQFKNIPSSENVIHIRGGDLFAKLSLFGKNQIHSDYTALPLDYYSQIIKESGEKWTFMIEPKTPRWYTRLLKDRFPNQDYLIGSDVRKDFQNLLSSRQLTMSVSSFSWVAVFLGEQDKIYFPKAGFLNLEIRPDIDLYFRSRKVQVLEVERHSWNGGRSEVKWLENSKVIHR